MIRNKNFKIIDDFLLDCPEISQDEREEIIECIKFGDDDMTPEERIARE